MWDLNSITMQISCTRSLRTSIRRKRKGKSNSGNLGLTVFLQVDPNCGLLQAFIAGAAAPLSKWEDDGVKLRSAAISLSVL